MIKRNNKIFEIAAKKGAEMSREKHFAAARKMMRKIGLPYRVIERVLYEPHNIRSTD
jgi:seryl-tRNA synthetase